MDSAQKPTYLNQVVSKHIKTTLYFYFQLLILQEFFLCHFFKNLNSPSSQMVIKCSNKAYKIKQSSTC